MTIPDNTDMQVDMLNDIEISVAGKTEEELELLVTETEETLQTLMNELKRRRHKALHKDVDNLDEYLEQADTSFKSLKNFIAMALKEIRG